MSIRYFLDTNLFVYTFDRRVPQKQRTAMDLIERALETREGVVSYQVVQEFLNVALRKFDRRMSAADARTYLDTVLMPLCEVFPDSFLFSQALSISEECGWGFYDSLIVSSAISAKCSVLLTEDLQAGRTVRGVEVRNPFA